MWQAIDGEFWPVPDTTDIVPWVDGEQDKTVFYRFIGGKWTTEKKPACASDLVGVVVSHTSMTSHDIEMRELVKKFSQEEGEKRGGDLSWSIEKIPKPTQEEKLQPFLIPCHLPSVRQSIHPSIKHKKLPRQFVQGSIWCACAL